MIDKSESVNWPNVWWILGADHLTFEGVMGDFRKKCPAGWFREEKSMQINSWEKNILHWKKYRSWRIMLKKNLTPLYVREQISYSREVWEKILPIQTKSVKSPTPHSPTNVQWSCQPFRGWGKKRIWHLCKVIHQQNGWCAFMMWWFSREVSKFLITRNFETRHVYTWFSQGRQNASSLHARSMKQALLIFFHVSFSTHNDCK